MRDLNYKHLYYFWTVAREGTIANASEILHLTPQTISGQIKLLEESFGTELLVKSGRNLVLTDAGRLALDYAEEIFSLGSEMQEMVISGASDRPRQFTVGIADVVPKLIAYRILEPALSLDEPIRIICREDKLDNLLADLAVHKIDIVLADSPMRPNMQVRAFNHLLGECGVSFFAAPELAKQYGGHFPYSLKNAPFLLPTSECAIRYALLDWFEKFDLQPRVVGEFDDRALMKAFGRAGVGIFSAPKVIENEIMRRYGVEIIGHSDEIWEQFYAVSGERQLKHPAVVAISQAAKQKIFGTGEQLSVPRKRKSRAKRRKNINNNQKVTRNPRSR